VTVTLTDAFSNPVLVPDLSGGGDQKVTLDSDDPNNPTFIYDYTGSTSNFIFSRVYAAPYNVSAKRATLEKRISLTRAELVRLLNVDPLSAQDDAPGLTLHQSRPIRIDPNAVSTGVIVLPGQKLNPGAQTGLGQSVFDPNFPPDTEVQGVEF